MAPKPKQICYHSKQYESIVAVLLLHSQRWRRKAVILLYIFLMNISTTHKNMWIHMMTVKCSVLFVSFSLISLAKCLSLHDKQRQFSCPLRSLSLLLFIQIILIRLNEQYSRHHTDILWTFSLTFSVYFWIQKQIAEQNIFRDIFVCYSTILVIHRRISLISY